MLKAKYIGKTYGTGYDRDMVFLEYEYRGYRSEVYENRAKGNEPLSWQHANEQGRIDTLIEQAQKPHTQPTETVQESLDKLWDYWETGEWKE